MKKTVIFILCIMLSVQNVFALSAEEAYISSNMTTFEDTVSWQGEYDVIVVGYGGAGAVASIKAADEGANVLLLEKAPMGQEGGNTRYAGQGILGLEEKDIDTAVEYFKNIRGKYNTPSDKMIKSNLTYSSKNYDWLMEIGADSVSVFPFQEYDYPGGEVMKALAVDGEVWTSSLYRTLQEAVEERADSIEVWYESPAVGLIQEPETKIIHGVKVNNNGNVLNIRARNGVVLCTGGFENNQQMIQDYLNLPYGYSKAARYNTGDGIKMAMEAGANLWHMGNTAGPDLNVLNPETGTTFTYAIQGEKDILSSGFAVQNTIFVGADGTRFINESVLPNHGYINFHGTWTQMTLSLPAYAVFDETARLSQTVYASWSKGNEEEIKNGLIVKADTIEELAEKIHVNPSNLTRQIKEYNIYCLKGQDPIFGRNKKYLKPIKSAPFYAMELVPSFTNTQGGPQRNENGEVLDTSGNIIPHLYSAGELGSMFSNIYQGTGNLGECVAFGRISGENAAKKKYDVSLNSVMDGKVIATASWKQADEIKVKSGEYIGEDRGIGGPLKVKVTMNGDKIGSVEVVYHNETRGVSQAAITKITKSVVEKQTADVDVVSGSTVTSRGIINAVKDALEQAGFKKTH